jgi:undecaprenyl-phosphate 4-deoxy-4-formamido-L-arabinose transferase
MSDAVRPAVSVVVPVYNGAVALETLVSRIRAALLPRNIEIVLVNDGSADMSWRTILELSNAYPGVRGLDLAHNFGQHNALLAGIRAARGDVIVTIDDDLQNPPEEIPVLLDRLAEGVDVVYGTPIERQHAFWRNVATRLVRFSLRSTMGRDVAQWVSPFRAFRADLRRGFDSFSGPDVSIDVLLSWATNRFAAVQVAHSARGFGKSTYSFAKLASLALTMLTGFSTRPLRIASLLGLASTFFGVLVLVYVFVRLIVEGNPVPGFPFLASLVAIFSGAQLLTLGVIGEYLGRVHSRTMDRPPYVIREEVGEAVGGTSLTTYEPGISEARSAADDGW